MRAASFLALIVAVFLAGCSVQPLPSPPVSSNISAPVHGPIVQQQPQPLAVPEAQVSEIRETRAETDPEPNEATHIWIKPYRKLDAAHTFVEGHWRRKTDAELQGKKEKPAPVPDAVKPSAPMAAPVEDSHAGMVRVNGYTRKNGTQVKGYWRRK